MRLITYNVSNVTEKLVHSRDHEDVTLSMNIKKPPSTLNAITGINVIGMLQSRA